MNGNCDDCGGFDIEWMYRCSRHGTEYCRGCDCPFCEEDEYFYQQCEELDKEWTDQ